MIGRVDIISELVDRTNHFIRDEWKSYQFYKTFAEVVNTMCPDPAVEYELNRIATDELTHFNIMVNILIASDRNIMRKERVHIGYMGCRELANLIRNHVVDEQRDIDEYRDYIDFIRENKYYIDSEFGYGKAEQIIDKIRTIIDDEKRHVEILEHLANMLERR
mgnify:CR=1 FL=1